MSSDQLGKYKLIKKIGQGGMAEIFLAKLLGAKGFEKEVVIKKILPSYSSNKEFLNMLIDEAKLAVQLTHANIVQVYELGQRGNDHFIVMEYISGMDLRHLWDEFNLKNTEIPLEVSLYIILQTLEGLVYAHSKKGAHGEPLHIVHRDISPQNILLDFDGTVKLTDFGIAKAAQKTSETASGVHKGKFSYMSPEQANLEEMGQRSDIFSVGIILYELMTGKRLLGGGSDIETLDRIRKISVRFSSDDEKKIPIGLRKLISKSLKRDPNDRFQTAVQFRDELGIFSRKGLPLITRESFSTFLEKKFSAPQYATKKRITAKKTVGTVSIALGVPRSKKRISPLTLILLSLVILVGAYAIFNRDNPKETSPPQPVGEVGTLNALVIPWGLVAIDGGEKKEAPLSQVALEPGSHKITAFYEPTDSEVSTSMTMKAGQRIRCIASFEEKEPIIRCQ